MPSIIPGYIYDIFISYRQNDNKYDGWVTEFVDNLNKELEANIKDKVSVYFDINPTDGLLETHSVDRSLEEKLKCLIFIPIISRTYCDPKSFAWQNEFVVFNKLAKEDQFGRDIRLVGGNVASRILPVKIHDLDPEDNTLLENELGGVLRGIEFIYNSAGVNRPLRANEDHPHDNLNKTYYRDQINKVSLAVKEVIKSLKIPVSLNQLTDKKNQTNDEEQPERVLKPVTKVPLTKGEKLKAKKLQRDILIIVSVTIILILGIFSIKMFYNKKKRQYARYELIPQIQKILEENPDDTFKAYELATEAENYTPDDSILINIWPQISETSSLQTQPEGAQVSWVDYNKPDDQWEIIGMTPLKDFRIPLGIKRIKIELEGFHTILITNLNMIGRGPDRFLTLDSLETFPENMIRIPSQIAPMNIIGFESYRGKRVEEFLVDRYEVTNKEYKRFMDSGGYQNKNYWIYPIYIEGKEISLDSTIKRFVDKTGIQGPAVWEVGNYPNGQETFPVSGISWYEAAAYAKFAGKKLPNAYQWSIIAGIPQMMHIIPFSNYSGKSILPVGSMKGMSPYGLFDIAGNVREWCFNGNGVPGEAYILGGGWNDSPYSFNYSGTQPSVDRSLSNGFRCIIELPGDTTFNSLSVPVRQEICDYLKERPVDDKTFNIFLRQYAYDKSPLNDQVIKTEDIGFCKVEKISIDAGYNNDRLIIYIFIPHDVQPPYQPIIFFPGANAIQEYIIKNEYPKMADFIIKSGRILVYPVLKGAYERKDELKSDRPDESVFYKDHVIMWRKDIGRTIDYLETRNDILIEKLGYFGSSWGGRMGGLYSAVEKRIKVVVLHVGGLRMHKTLPEVDPFNFLPKVYQPFLMLNGKYDMYFPVETSQVPMFNLLGTPEKDKKRIAYETGHLVPRTELIKETLAWFDKYLGPVKK